VDYWGKQFNSFFYSPNHKKIKQTIKLLTINNNNIESQVKLILQKIINLIMIDEMLD